MSDRYWLIPMLGLGILLILSSPIGLVSWVWAKVRGE